jgi:hypothetical protein
MALAGAARHKVGPIPRKNVPRPSLRKDLIAQSSAPEYFLLSVPTPSVWSRDLMTSGHVSAVGIPWAEDPLDMQRATLLLPIYTHVSPGIHGDRDTMRRRNITSTRVYLPGGRRARYRVESAFHTSKSTFSSESRGTNRGTYPIPCPSLPIVGPRPR